MLSCPIQGVRRKVRPSFKHKSLTPCPDDCETSRHCIIVIVRLRPSGFPAGATSPGSRRRRGIPGNKQQQSATNSSIAETINSIGIAKSEPPWTYSVDNDGCEDGRRNLRPVFGIILAADELGMVTPEKEAENGQNNDCKYRNNKAVQSISLTRLSRVSRPTTTSPTKTMLASHSRWASSWTAAANALLSDTGRINSKMRHD